MCLITNGGGRREVVTLEAAGLGGGGPPAFEETRNTLGPSENTGLRPPWSGRGGFRKVRFSCGLCSGPVCAHRPHFHGLLLPRTEGLKPAPSLLREGAPPGEQGCSGGGPGPKDPPGGLG